jgi:hypothetical protein
MIYAIFDWLIVIIRVVKNILYKNNINYIDLIVNLLRKYANFVINKLKNFKLISIKIYAIKNKLIANSKDAKL